MFYSDYEKKILCSLSVLHSMFIITVNNTLLDIARIKPLYNGYRPEESLCTCPQVLRKPQKEMNITHISVLYV